MTTPNAKVLVVHVSHVIAANVASAKTSEVIAANSSDVTSAKSSHATSAKPAHAASAKASHVASAKAAHVASAKAAHVASAKSATHVAAATATATASLCSRSKKAPGKHRARQNHHRSSSHDFLHLVGRTCRHRTILKRHYSTKVISNVTMKERWECRSVASTKFSFNQQKLCGRTNGCRLARRTISML
jgi:hypothetical protein